MAGSKTLGELSNAALESLANDYGLAAKSVEAELERRYGTEHVPAPIAEGIEKLSVAELAALRESYGREADAIGAEQKRRHDSAWGIKPMPLSQPRTRRMAAKPCPTCGKRDAVRDSRTLYDSPQLAHGGNVVCTAAICACGTWFNSATGEPIGPNSGFTY